MGHRRLVTRGGGLGAHREGGISLELALISLDPALRISLVEHGERSEGRVRIRSAHPLHTR
jgi:hypothetical protein